MMRMMMSIDDGLRIVTRFEPGATYWLSSSSIRRRRRQSVLQQLKLQVRMKKLDVGSIVVDVGRGVNAIWHQTAEHLLWTQWEEILLVVMMGWVVLLLVLLLLLQ